MRCGWASAEGRLYFGVMHGFHDLLFARLKNDAEHMHANLQRNAIIQGFDFMPERMEPHSFSLKIFISPRPRI